MMPTLVESLILMAFSAIGMAAWWGFRRLIAIQDHILEQLTKINGRLGKSETWQDQHEKRDDERFGEIKQVERDMWTALERTRAQ